MEDQIVDNEPEDLSVRHAAIYQLAREQGLTVLPVEEPVGDLWPELEEGELDIDFDEFLAMTRHPERSKDLS